jgi:hypothetical protein
MTVTTHHHLTAHWVGEDEGVIEIHHHHLKEVWEDDDEAPITTPKSADSAMEEVS